MEDWDELFARAEGGRAEDPAPSSSSSTGTVGAAGEEGAKAAASASAPPPRRDDDDSSSSACRGSRRSPSSGGGDRPSDYWRRRWDWPPTSDDCLVGLLSRHRPRCPPSIPEVAAADVKNESPPSEKDLALEKDLSRHYSRCGQCRESLGLHLLGERTGGATSAQSLLLQLFADVRNLRCLAKCGALRLRQSSADAQDSSSPADVTPPCKPRAEEVFANVRGAMTSRLRGGLAKNRNLFAQVSKASDSCCEAVEVLVCLLEKDYGGGGGADYQLFEASVRVVIACDEVYYRLYYAQLQLLSQERTSEDCMHRDRLIPHPAEYFGNPGLSGHHPPPRPSGPALRDERKLAPREKERRDQLWDYVGRNCSLRGNSLSALHRCRFSETRALFQSWMSAPETLEQWKETLSPERRSPKGDPLHQRHETLAPPLLSEWRDSCRDFPCHLYAYATLSNLTVRDVGRSLQLPAVEVGAGTGYLAFLLRKELGRGEVRATDVAPTAHCRNEYHGATPPFTLVESAEASQVNGSTHNTLILCYPPPQQPMALQALTHFRRTGGMTVLHIGEMKGLTGTTDMERHLLQHFVCTRRWPCMTWGTDAAEATLWVKKQNKKRKKKRQRTQTKDDSVTLLVPCSRCRTKEAVGRCRLLRFLNYCSHECFRADRQSRREYLAIFMIDLQDAIPLEFDNPQHFYRL